MNFHCLHGFLGSAKDFDFLREEFQEAHVFGPSLFADHSWNYSFKDFGRQYNAHVRSMSEKPNLLLGYSLGGRLALHALLDNETLYQGAVIVSAHLGLECDEEKKLRLEQDRVLAKQLNEVPFHAFLEEWNRRPLFKGSPEMLRDQADFEIASLQHALTVWSLGLQENLLNKIEALSIPILFIAGEKDLTYSALAQKLCLKNPKSKVWIAKETNHRVPWQSKEKFVETLRQFIVRSIP